MIGDLMSDEDPRATRPLPFRFLPLPQREIALLIVLCVVSAAVFAGTRRLAAWSSGRRAAEAAEWYARGQRLVDAGDRGAGIAALREAVAADRQNPRYVLALARSLDDGGNDDEARQLLLGLRQRQPDDVEVNYRLAGQAALRGDLAEAIRYYNYAMYGLARIGKDYERREIREELIGLLIDHGDLQEAGAQLASLSREVPDTAEAQLSAGALADRAGDAAKALQFYERASFLDPKSAPAAAGAGAAAYRLKDYRRAVREMDRAVNLGADAPELKARLAVARLVLASDPTAERVAGSERVRRVMAGLSRAADRLDACGKAMGTSPAVETAQADIERYRRMRSAAIQDQDTLAEAVAAIGRALTDVSTRCAALVEPIDQAWLLIAALPGGAS
jgi:tetratricopeptide (TPR) repeat protein